MKLRFIKDPYLKGNLDGEAYRIFVDIPCIIDGKKKKEFLLLFFSMDIR